MWLDLPPGCQRYRALLWLRREWSSGAFSRVYVLRGGLSSTEVVISFLPDTPAHSMGLGRIPLDLGQGRGAGHRQVILATLKRETSRGFPGGRAHLPAAPDPDVDTSLLRSTGDENIIKKQMCTQHRTRHRPTAPEPGPRGPARPSRERGHSAQGLRKPFHLPAALFTRLRRGCPLAALHTLTPSDHPAWCKGSHPWTWRSR